MHIVILYYTLSMYMYIHVYIVYDVLCTVYCTSYVVNCISCNFIVYSKLFIIYLHSIFGHVIGSWDSIIR